MKITQATKSPSRTTKSPSRTTKTSPTKTPKKPVKPESKQDTGPAETHLEGDGGDGAMGIKLDQEEAVIEVEVGVSTELDNPPLSEPIPATAFTPDTASRVGQIIATQTSLSKDLQTRLPHATALETGEPAPEDEPAVSEEPLPVEPDKGTMY